MEEAVEVVVAVVEVLAEEEEGSLPVPPTITRTRLGPGRQTLGATCSSSAQTRATVRCRKDSTSTRIEASSRSSASHRQSRGSGRLSHLHLPFHLISRPGSKTTPRQACKRIQRDGVMLPTTSCMPFLNAVHGMHRDERGRALAPLSSENSVDQSDTASLTTDKSWTDQSTSGADEYREYGRSPKNRRLPGLGDRQGQGDDDYPRRSSLLSSPVFIKDHRVGMMSDYTKNKATFSSHALTLEAELKELLVEQKNRKFLPKHGDYDPATAPDVVASRRMMGGLAEIAERPGTYQKVLMMISQNLHSLVFAPTSEDDVGQPPIPYFALCTQLRSQVKKLEVELGVAYQNMEEGEAGEGGGVSPKKNKRADSKIVYGDVRAKEEEIKALRKSNEELNKVVADITRKVTS